MTLQAPPTTQPLVNAHDKTASGAPAPAPAAIIVNHPLEQPLGALPASAAPLEHPYLSRLVVAVDQDRACDARSSSSSLSLGRSDGSGDPRPVVGQGAYYLDDFTSSPSDCSSRGSFSTFSSTSAPSASPGVGAPSLPLPHPPSFEAEQMPTGSKDWRGNPEMWPTSTRYTASSWAKDRAGGAARAGVRWSSSTVSTMSSASLRSSTMSMASVSTTSSAASTTAASNPSSQDTAPVEGSPVLSSGPFPGDPGGGGRSQRDSSSRSYFSNLWLDRGAAGYDGQQPDCSVSTPISPPALPFLDHRPAPPETDMTLETTETMYTLVTRLPGFQLECITLATKHHRTLHVVADKWEKDGGGHFERRITFGTDAEMSAIKAEFDGGVLKVFVPRRVASASTAEPGGQRNGGRDGATSPSAAWSSAGPGR